MKTEKVKQEMASTKKLEVEVQKKRSEMVVDRSTAENKDADTLKKLAETAEIEDGDTDGS